MSLSALYVVVVEVLLVRGNYLEIDFGDDDSYHYLLEEEGYDLFDIVDNPLSQLDLHDRYVDTQLWVTCYY